VIIDDKTIIIKEEANYIWFNFSEIKVRFVLLYNKADDDYYGSF
jgi:hypothetical protein